ncbi:amino acid transporter [Defluviimonas sp. 20V17]|uniref:Amino acid transporter n=1 Tax=Allgaiera indica TaxID=765699 RepID=A0AAN4UTK9_9RHOB|nr:LysE/ArgO family amino acid transporter [Allgaiera indica]KDB05408.1 amino acid transporter [Defluviimonas sp. 20V17]GHE04138.1 amino acid transporter [Allgaiera indica]SDX49806.1 L-lysine exporter family protein LysE/ArgO [Allgaiera indica]
MFKAALTGFLTGGSLILAIGAQNAFVLRQGLLRAHVLPLVLLCAMADAVLISLGVLGFGAVVALWPALPRLLSLAGAAFLAFYGAQRLVAAWKGDYALVLRGESAGLWKTLAAGAAFTWLNPHVYLDTLGLIGAVSTQFHGGGAKTAFAIGAITASFAFFFSLGFGARLLAPVMTSRRAWQVLDLLIGAVMWGLAAELTRGAL